MNIEKLPTSDIFYTNDHEWIKFQDIIAYAGVCSFKLLGYKAIDEITFGNLEGFKKRGDHIANIKYNDYEIIAHMPVDGQILSVNRELLFVDKNILLRYPENKGWIALIMPTEPRDHTNLLTLKQYEIRNKCRYVK